MLEVESIDEALVTATRDLLAQGHSTAPRGRPTLEILAYGFKLRNPRARKITLRAREWSEALAVGELCWHMAGSDAVDFISYYGRRWTDFSDDGQTIRGSCYGKKIFGSDETGGNQWERAKSTLMSDRSSRRALILLHDAPRAGLSDAKDVACITAIQYLLRGDSLHCVTTMRSNDLIWGTCYDVFVTTMLQERLACELGVELGWYQHFCGSIHVYEELLPIAEAIAFEGTTNDPFVMPPMADVDRIPAFLAVEERMRLGQSDGVALAERLPVYWRQLAKPLVERHERRWASSLV